MDILSTLSQQVSLIQSILVFIPAFIVSVSPLIIVYFKQKRKIKSLQFTRDQILLFDAIFLNVEETKAEIRKLITNTGQSTNTLTIDNFGLDLETITPMLKYTFTEAATKRDIRYRGLIIDPKSDNIKKFCVGKSNINQEDASRNIAEIKKNIMDNLIVANIEITSYDQPPIIHGFLIDGEHLFLGFTNFGEKNSDNNGLRGGSSPYIYLKKDDTSEFKKILFSTYTSWFSYWWRNGIKQVP